MNDIEVLEEFKKNGYAMLYMKYGDRNTTNLKIKNAIENLLKERQSDKERIKDLEENYSILENAYFTDNIPKSLIKEKIEPVINNLERDGFVGYADELRDILEELLNTKM